MKDITIGVFFGTILHENMGCNALNYSFMQLCEELAKQEQWRMHYIMFWDLPSNFSSDDLPSELKQFDITFMRVPDSYVKLLAKGILKDHMHDYNSFFNTVKMCDFFVDSCGGDSFSDIYGPYTLNYILKNHRLAYKYHKPIILLPQTIGPFNTDAGKKKASEMLKKAAMIYVRDNISEDVASLYTQREKVFLTIDMAFHLPYNKVEPKERCSNRAIGVSPSALLWHGGYNGSNQFGLKSDYQCTIRTILEYLFQNGCKVHLLGHVLYGTASKPREDDYWLCKRLHEEYPETIMAPYFYTPVEAKSYISTLDGLMSSRMHCCIGAYSACVPVFTLGYSRKFNGLFIDTLHYKYGTDLRTDNINDSLTHLREFLNDIPLIKEVMPDRLEELRRRKEAFLTSLSKTIKLCIRA